MKGLGACSRTVQVISAVVIAGLATGCSGAKVVTKSSADLPRYQIRSLALLPFTSIATPQARDQEDLFVPTPQAIRQSDMSMAIPSDAKPVPKKTMVVPGFAAEKVTELFWGRLQDRKGLQILSPSESAKIAFGHEGVEEGSLETAAADVAKKLKADAALMGIVSAYQERVGSRLGADPPASVGFQVSVVAADGKVLWVGRYYERQRPMTEDLTGFLQRWAFVTAAELAEYGVEEVLKEFPFGKAGGE